MRLNLPEMTSDADYRAMLASCIHELLHTLIDGDTERAISMCQMALALNNYGADSKEAHAIYADALLRFSDDLQMNA